MAPFKTYRFSKLSALIAGAGLLLVSAQTNAASPAQHYPSQGWEIAQSSPVDSRFSGDICTIMARYTNGTMLSMSGQGPQIGAISIDFGQALFADASAYDVILSVPGAFTQSVPATALQNRMLNIALEDNGDFYQAIKRHGVMDLKIKGEDFRFFLTGFHAAAGRYEICAKALTPAEEPQIQVQQTATLPEPEPEISALTPPPPPKTTSTSERQETPPVPVAEPLDLPPKITASTELPSPVPTVKPQTKPAYLSEAPALPVPGERPYRRLSEQLAAQMERENQKSRITLAPAAAPQAPAASQTPEIMTPMPSAISAPEMEKEMVQEMQDQATETAQSPEPETPAEPESTPAEKLTVADITTEAPAPEPQQEPQPEPVIMLKSPEPTITKTTKDIGTIDLTAVEPSSAPSSTPAEEPPVIEEVKAVSAVPVVPPGAGAKDLAKLENTIDRLIDQNETLQNENRALNAELFAALKETQNEKTSIETNNWNLERATLRYNEAERQLERLGLQLQKHRAQCAQEKMSLENMLFDPALTSQSQIATLSSLEEKLQNAQRHIRELEARLDATQR